MSGWDLGFIGFSYGFAYFLLSAFTLLCLHILLICTCIAILLCFLYFSPLSADLLIRASIPLCIKIDYRRDPSVP